MDIGQILQLTRLRQLAKAEAERDCARAGFAVDGWTVLEETEERFLEILRAADGRELAQSDLRADDGSASHIIRFPDDVREAISALPVE